ncbi:hypothetical protein PAPYR_2681 [Paratrimastix pyriformis]|uniref:3'-5' exonuclease domain-containing protein n=1 Tax=Paratrimastix pyriformis TaxID=342808 RepID=A0ABQ8UNW7_9EUKA|nr:hypothetical protein PAPYR_2681 [Paratrimastix pyriformis]
MGVPGLDLVAALERHVAGRLGAIQGLAAAKDGPARQAALRAQLCRECLVLCVVAPCSPVPFETALTLAEEDPPIPTRRPVLTRAEVRGLHVRFMAAFPGRARARVGLALELLLAAPAGAPSGRLSRSFELLEAALRDGAKSARRHGNRRTWPHPDGVTLARYKQARQYLRTAQWAIDQRARLWGIASDQMAAHMGLLAAVEASANPSPDGEALCPDPAAELERLAARYPAWADPRLFHGDHLISCLPAPACQFHGDHLYRGRGPSASPADLRRASVLYEEALALHAAPGAHGPEQQGAALGALGGLSLRTGLDPAEVAGARMHTGWGALRLWVATRVSCQDAVPALPRLSCLLRLSADRGAPAAVAGEDLAAVQSCLAAATAACPWLPTAWYRRGVAALMRAVAEDKPRGPWTGEALTSLHRAVQLQPAQPPAFTALAWAYLWAGYFDSALRCALQAVGQSGHEQDAGELLCFALARPGPGPAAGAEDDGHRGTQLLAARAPGGSPAERVGSLCANLAQLWPGARWAWVWAGLAAQLQPGREEAVAGAFQQALRLMGQEEGPAADRDRPGPSESQPRAVAASVRRRPFDGAEAALEADVRLHCWRALGEANLALGKAGAAGRCFEEALSVLEASAASPAQEGAQVPEGPLFSVYLRLLQGGPFAPSCPLLSPPGAALGAAGTPGVASRAQLLRCRAAQAKAAAGDWEAALTGLRPLLAELPQCLVVRKALAEALYRWSVMGLLPSAQYSQAQERLGEAVGVLAPVMPALGAYCPCPVGPGGSAGGREDASRLVGFWKLAGDCGWQRARSMRPELPHGQGAPTDQAAGPSLAQQRGEALRLARRSYLRCIHLAPWLVTGWSDMAGASLLAPGALAPQGDPDQQRLAQRLCECAIVTNPKYAPAWNLLGLCHKTFDVRRHAFVTAIELDKVLRVIRESDAVVGALREIELSAGGIVAFDVEWKPDFAKGTRSPPALLQLSSESLVVLFQLLFLSPEAVASIREFMAKPALLKCGYSIGTDLLKLAMVGISCAPLADVQVVARELGIAHSGLAGLHLSLHGQTVVKAHKTTMSNWALPVLSPHQVHYAAQDAYLTRRCYMTLIGGHPQAATLRFNTPPKLRSLLDLPSSSPLPASSPLSASSPLLNPSQKAARARGPAAWAAPAPAPSSGSAATNTRAWNNYGLLLVGQHLHKLAANVFVRSLSQVRPAPTLTARVRALAASWGSLTVAAARSVGGQDPNAAEVWLGMAALAMEQGRPARALECFRWSADLALTPLGRRGMAALAHRAGLPQSATAALKEAQQAGPEAPWAAHNYALAAEQRGLLSEAVRGYGRAWLVLDHISAAAPADAAPALAAQRRPLPARPASPFASLRFLFAHAPHLLPMRPSPVTDAVPTPGGDPSPTGAHAEAARVGLARALLLSNQTRLGVAFLLAPSAPSSAPYRALAAALGGAASPDEVGAALDGAGQAAGVPAGLGAAWAEAQAHLAARLAALKKQPQPADWSAALGLPATGPGWDGVECLGLAAVGLIFGNEPELGVSAASHGLALLGTGTGTGCPGGPAEGAAAQMRLMHLVGQAFFLAGDQPTAHGWWRSLLAVSPPPAPADPSQAPPALLPGGPAYGQALATARRALGVLGLAFSEAALARDMVAALQQAAAQERAALGRLADGGLTPAQAAAASLGAQTNSPGARLADGLLGYGLATLQGMPAAGRAVLGRLLHEHPDRPFLWWLLSTHAARPLVADRLAPECPSAGALILSRLPPEARPHAAKGAQTQAQAQAQAAPAPAAPSRAPATTAAPTGAAVGLRMGLQVAPVETLCAAAELLGGRSGVHLELEMPGPEGPDGADEGSLFAATLGGLSSQATVEAARVRLARAAHLRPGSLGAWTALAAASGAHLLLLPSAPDRIRAAHTHITAALRLGAALFGPAAGTVGLAALLPPMPACAEAAGGPAGHQVVPIDRVGPLLWPHLRPKGPGPAWLASVVCDGSGLDLGHPCLPAPAPEPAAFSGAPLEGQEGPLMASPLQGEALWATSRARPLSPMALHGLYLQHLALGLLWARCALEAARANERVARAWAAAAAAPDLPPSSSAEGRLHEAVKQLLLDVTQATAAVLGPELQSRQQQQQLQPTQGLPLTASQRAQWSRLRADLLTVTARWQLVHLEGLLLPPTGPAPAPAATQQALGQSLLRAAQSALEEAHRWCPAHPAACAELAALYATHGQGALAEQLMGSLLAQPALPPRLREAAGLHWCRLALQGGLPQKALEAAEGLVARRGAAGCPEGCLLRARAQLALGRPGPALEGLRDLLDAAPGGGPAAFQCSPLAARGPLAAAICQAAAEAHAALGEAAAAAAELGSAVEALHGCLLDGGRAPGAGRLLADPNRPGPRLGGAGLRVPIDGAGEPIRPAPTVTRSSASPEAILQAAQQAAAAQQQQQQQAALPTGLEAAPAGAGAAPVAEGAADEAAMERAVRTLDGGAQPADPGLRTALVEAEGRLAATLAAQGHSDQARRWAARAVHLDPTHSASAALWRAHSRPAPPHPAAATM